MEITIENVSWTATQTDVKSLLAERLHGLWSAGSRTAPFEFHVNLSKDPRGMQLHSGSGFLTVPTEAIGARFLDRYGVSGLACGGKVMRFSESSRGPRPEILQRIKLLDSYLDPRIEDDIQYQTSGRGTEINIAQLQFGWDCRDKVLSIEAEAVLSHCNLSFDTKRRRLSVRFVHRGSLYDIGIRLSQIEFVTTHLYQRHEPVIIFSLTEAPIFEVEKGTNRKSNRAQLSYLPVPDNHRYVAPYVSLVVRLVCQGKNDLKAFRRLCGSIGFRHLRPDHWEIDRRAIFSKKPMELYSDWLTPKNLPWIVAFQVEAIIRKRIVDVREMLDILPIIKNLVRDEGRKYVAGLLQDFSGKAAALYRSGRIEDSLPNAVRLCFEAVARQSKTQVPKKKTEAANGRLWGALHVTVTPTTVLLDGPHPELSNRVIRLFGEEHHESFLRVTFAEEGGYKLRFDREVDAEGYIQSRIRTIFLERLVIAHREFEFLAYSQSALKEHTVWFVKPFKVDGEWVRARDIIDRLGNFDDLPFDPKLSLCPARLAARISQAFTSTSPSMTLNVDEIIIGRDTIVVSRSGDKYDFTDGVGTMSRTVAREAWQAYGGSPAHSSPAKQVRIGGAKGMLSTDYTLQGRVVVLRPSMIKFEAPDAKNIEIAGTFHRPIAYFLNRPLVMLLEGLGVRYEVFKRFQDRAIQQVEEAATALSRAASLLQEHGLGSSYHLPAILNQISELGFTSLPDDSFLSKSLDFAKHHVLRGIKLKARIPIPGAWTLVGVADVHGYLKPNEVFICVRPVDEEPIFLEGPVVVSRSPVIHPGDVQIAHAIGRPPQGSCFDHEPLANTIVFSIKGDRPLPSCLGGGDLDGDIYNIIPLEDPAHPELAGFKPKTCPPSTYPAAKRHLLNRRASMKDIAEFVMDYMLSDMVGIIATRWLETADSEGIHHPNCIRLAHLHSNAVDYPKSGTPVDRKELPPPVRDEKPDWSAPETVVLTTDAADTDRKYYRSRSALGRLFRAIELPADERRMEGATAIYSLSSESRDQALRKIVSHPFYQIIYDQVRRHIAVDEDDNDLNLAMDRLFARYKTDLQKICITKSLSFSKNSSLTEEEAMMGTIVQKTSSPQRRKKVMLSLRDSTEILVNGIREALELPGESGNSGKEYLRRSWVAWKAALGRGHEFGAQSFGWVALGCIIAAMKELDNDRQGSGNGLGCSLQ